MNDALFTGPDMKVVRSSFTCNVDSDGYLYAIGGDAIGNAWDSIERINVSDISNIPSKSWQYISGTLSVGRNLLSSCAINNNLYIMGGGGDGSPDYSTNAVEVIYSTENENVYTDAVLPIQVRAGCAVCVGQSLYYIGGVNSSDHNINDIFRTRLIDPLPTNEPTINPTIDPTTDPTPDPTIDPTANPTNNPTINPTPSNSLNDWISLTEKLPIADSQFLCGYHQDSNSIFVLGGYGDPTAVWQWDLTNNKFNKHSALVPAVVRKNGQGYVTYGDYIYTVEFTKIGRYNMATNVFTYPLSSQNTLATGRRLCLSISSDGNYLFIIGGVNGMGNIMYQKFQIYDITNDYLFGGPDMNVARSALTCYADNDGYLYAIGGEYEAGTRDSIEKIRISNILNIPLSWEYISGTNYKLGLGRNMLRSCEINANLYILGGSTGVGSTNTADVIYNTDNENVYSDAFLPLGIRAGCAVCVRQTIYYLGGINNSDHDINDIFWTNLVDPLPTDEPTSNPTQPTIRVQLPTNDGRADDEPSMFPSYTPTVAHTKLEESEAKNAKLINNFYIRNMPLFIAGVLAMLILISYIYSKKMRANDFYKVSALIIVSFHILDMFSDVLFSVSVSANKNTLIIFILSLIFIVVPLSISLCQLHTAINTKWLKSNEFKAWIKDNISILFILSVITGSSFTAIDLCRSNLFNLSQFDIPLSKTEISLFKTQRIYSIILCENIPQIVLQCWYIAISSKTGTTTEIVYISLIFSTISIIITAVSLFTQKTVINMMDYVEIQFEVNGADIGSRLVQCQNIVKQPQREIAAILGINRNITDIYRPTQIPNGLKVKMRVYVSISKAIDMNCQKLLQNARDSGKLAEIFGKCWSLSEAPMIGKIECVQINSKNRSENTINIAGANSTDAVGEQLSNDANGMNEAVQIAMTELIRNQNQNSVVNIVPGSPDSPQQNIDGFGENTDILIPPVPETNVTAGADAPSVEYVKSMNKIKSYDSDSCSSSSQHVTIGKTTE